MLDEKEFLSPTASARSPNSRAHPFVLYVRPGATRRLPAGESNTGMFGQLNWRGPVWMPVNALIIRALLNFYLYYGRQFQNRMSTAPEAVNLRGEQKRSRTG